MRSRVVSTSDDLSVIEATSGSTKIVYDTMSKLPNIIKWNEPRTPSKFGDEVENSRSQYDLNWSG